ncbi:hypothetical protein [Poseidonocella sp. HB161398]|uniref:hypothetical protein n=1 Tax=Poseidonocella sp. HB161398 TaxID=2320855 RepID=UPI0011091318|nr:hypothetical protein [Poseidonocella sp. HB161398]
METRLAVALAFFAGAIAMLAVGVILRAAQARKPQSDLDRSNAALRIARAEMRAAEAELRAAEAERRAALLLSQVSEAEDWPRPEPGEPASGGRWTEVSVPPNRPRGDWVNWTFGNGWVRIRGTAEFAEDIRAFIHALSRNYVEELCTIEVELERGGDGRNDRTIFVGASVSQFRTTTYHKLGYLDCEAANWLAENFDRDMPIAAELLRLATDGDRYAIKVACLMPKRRARVRYDLT